MQAVSSSITSLGVAAGPIPTVDGSPAHGEDRTSANKPQQATRRSESNQGSRATDRAPRACWSKTLASRRRSMRPSRRSKRSRHTVAAITALAFCACQGAGPVRVREVFDLVNPGMSCAEVEAMLGQPVLRCSSFVSPLVGDEEAWYLPPPEIRLLDAPWGPGTICVVYSHDNRVISKRLNPQLREPQATLGTKAHQPTGAPRGAGG